MRASLVVVFMVLMFGASGCGYMVCRGFMNTSEQCAYDCTFEPQLDSNGNKIPDQFGRPGDYKIEKTCTYNLKKVLIP